MPRTEEEWKRIISEAKATYEAMTNAEKVKHDYEQRRSFVRGMCPDNRDYAEYCKQVDTLLPPLEEEMSKNTYDLERQCWVKAPPTGTYNFISFKRLAETLRETGEIRPNETLTHFEIRDYGLHYRVDRKTDTDSAGLVYDRG